MRNLFWIWILVALIGLGGCASDGGTQDAGPDGLDADGADAHTDQDGDGPGDGDVEIDGADQGPVELTVTGVLPSRGPIEGGTWTNIIGSGFVEGIGESPFDVRDVTDVFFGDNAAIDIEVIRDDMISVRTPTGVAGLSEVTVENPNGRVSLADAFDYFETVRVDAFAPTDFSANGGTAFSIDGTGFTPDTEVLVADRPAAGVLIESPIRLTGFAPPAEPGPADVQIVNRNGNVLLFRAATYHASPRLALIDPAAGPQGGGTAVSATGEGFEQGLQLLFGGVLASDVLVLDQAQIEATSPAGQPGAVDVEVAGPVDGHLLQGGYVYLPPATGGFALTGVAPATGSVEGGQQVTLAGEGFEIEAIENVRFGPSAATGIQVLSDRLLRVDVPPGIAGEVDLQVETASLFGELLAGYRYWVALQLNAITPDLGPVEGGTPFEISGEGFSAATLVLIGGLPATDLVLESDTRISGISPPGTQGAVNVMVRDADSQAVLEDAFTFETGLDLQRVDPDFGSQAGGTYVTIFGSGFAPGMRIWFGQDEASLVQVHSPSVVTVRTPRGEPGEVTVAVELGQTRAELVAGYSYVDPTNDRGGASGGTISGSVNVTCLDGTWVNWGAPVPDATVLIDSPSLTGLTDERGQLTFSGPSLVREVNLTIGKEGYESITVWALNATNLTVYLYPNEQEPTDPGQVEITYSSINGRVFGFKDVADLPTGPTINHQAMVNFTSWSIYSVPPYGGIPRGTEILEDGDGYQYTVRLGEYSLYAMYGAYDTETFEFTPALLGVRRGIQAPTADPVLNQDIVLSTPLDRSVTVQLVEPPLGDAEDPAEYGAYVSLDLGADGIIYLNQAKGVSAELVLTGLPEATGDSFLFTGLASKGGGYPYSYVFRRQAGGLEDGVQMGPFLGFTRLTEPEPDQELVGGRIAWEYDGPEPELTQILIQTSELMPKTLWRVIVPGEVKEVQLPEELLGTLPQGEPLVLLLYTADSPRFNFDRFNYGQLSSGRWTAYTVNFASITAP